MLPRKRSKSIKFNLYSISCCQEKEVNPSNQTLFNIMLPRKGSKSIKYKLDSISCCQKRRQINQISTQLNIMLPKKWSKSIKSKLYSISCCQKWNQINSCTQKNHVLCETPELFLVTSSGSHHTTKWYIQQGTKHSCHTGSTRPCIHHLTGKQS